MTPRGVRSPSSRAARPAAHAARRTTRCSCAMAGSCTPIRGRSGSRTAASTRYLPRVEPGSPTRRCRGYPNGLALAPDGLTIAVVESEPPVVATLELRSDGSLGGRRVLAVLPGGVPDGAAYDERSNLLVSFWVPDAIVAIAPGWQRRDRARRSPPPVPDLTDQPCIRVRVGRSDLRELRTASSSRASGTSGAVARSHVR